MKKTLLLTHIFCISLISTAQQGMENVIAEIEKNNTFLVALQAQTEAERAGNKTGIFLPNPEFEIGYLWGNPDDIGNRTDMSISQSFDFPTSYVYGSKIAKTKNEQLNIEYDNARREIIFQSKSLIIDIIFYNKKSAYYAKRMEHERSIAHAYATQFEDGAITIIEYNKAQLNFLKTKKELELLTIEKNALLGKLSQLNGGITLEIADTVFEETVIPGNFDEWYLQRAFPKIKAIEKEQEISRLAIKQQRALALPKFSVAYVSEHATDNKFQGIAAGMSIPLWEHKNKTKQAKLYSLSVESDRKNMETKLYNDLKQLYMQIVQLQAAVTDYRAVFNGHDNTLLLAHAFDAGALSLVEYMYEQSINYEHKSKLFELEKELQKKLAELYKYQ